MKRFYRDLRLAVIVAILAFAACWLVGKTYMAGNSASYSYHSGLHKELGITEEQHQKLIPIEDKFLKKKERFEMEIDLANKELAEAINQEEEYSERVSRSVDKIHVAHGELQKATLEHLFEMRAVLNPEQRKKLNLMATNALTHH